MKNTDDSPLGRNPFAKAFAEFDEQTFFENLHNQVKNKPYFEKYQGFKTTILSLSYLFNFASALTASYAIYWLTEWLTGIAILGYILAGVFLFFLEKIKRKSSSEFWQVYFFRKQIAIGWLGLSLFCFGLSLASSSFGTKQGTEHLSPTPELLAADSLALHYASEIERLETINTELRANKDKNGTTFYKLYTSINANTAVIQNYRKRAQELEQQLSGKNHQLNRAYIEKVSITAWALVWITIIMELLFEACLAYIWYYYYRSYIERLNVQKDSFVHTKDVQKGDNKHTLSTISKLETTLKLLEAENEALRTQNQSPPPSPNDTTVLNRTPIGFKCGHTGTHENTQLARTVDDKYTIPHTYTKGGQTITVHYNATMVKSRIGEYERKIKEAEEKAMGEHILANRQRWLAYWQEKQQELQAKSITLNSSNLSVVA